eukprot:COSAG06_NODE_1560_length_9104_cov_82.958468_5_plen_64_part_00
MGELPCLLASGLQSGYLECGPDSECEGSAVPDWRWPPSRWGHDEDQVECGPVAKKRKEEFDCT